MAKPLEIDKEQMADTNQNQEHNTAMQAGKRIGLVRQAGKMTLPSQKNALAPHRRPRPWKNGVFVGENHCSAPGTAPDGYMRKTPVQEIKVDPTYKARLIKRVLAAIAGLALITLIAYIMLRFIAFF